MPTTKELNTRLKILDLPEIISVSGNRVILSKYNNFEDASKHEIAITDIFKDWHVSNGGKVLIDYRGRRKIDLVKNSDLSNRVFYSFQKMLACKIDMGEKEPWKPVVFYQDLSVFLDNLENSGETWVSLKVSASAGKRLMTAMIEAYYKKNIAA